MDDKKFELCVIIIGWSFLVLTCFISGAMIEESMDRGERYTTKYDCHFRKYTKRYFGREVDWRLFKAQAIAESGLNPHAKSHVGAQGLMQIMPATMGELAGKNSELKRKPNSPRWNIAAGIRYNRDLWNFWEKYNGHKWRHKERLSFIFGSYNAGMGNIQKAYRLTGEKKKWKKIIKVAPNVKTWRCDETINYVRRIWDIHRSLCY